MASRTPSVVATAPIHRYGSLEKRATSSHSTIVPSENTPRNHHQVRGSLRMLRRIALTFGRTILAEKRDHHPADHRRAFRTGRERTHAGRLRRPAPPPTSRPMPGRAGRLSASLLELPEHRPQTGGGVKAAGAIRDGQNPPVQGSVLGTPARHACLVGVRDADRRGRFHTLAAAPLYRRPTHVTPPARLGRSGTPASGGG